MKNIITFYAAALALLLAACDIINPSEEAPAYLYIADITKQTNPDTEGSNSHKITEAWVFVDNEFLGAYPLPALVPVLAEGESEIRIEAGIKDNGISSTPEIYPFYEPWRVTLNLEPNQIDTLSPVARYLDNAGFAFIENFEDIDHIFQDLRQGADENRIQLTDDAFEGEHAGLIYLDTAHAVVELATSDQFSGLQDNSVYVYLELNYKSDIPVLFGIIGRDNGVTGASPYYDPGFLSKGEWNKIYFNLSALMFNNKFDNYQIGIYTAIPYSGGKFERQNARVWLDNIKLVYFK
jgi:hypothetical protein